MAYDIRFDVSTPGAESLSAVDSIVQKLSGSTGAASGQLKIFEAVLKADAAAGISLAESLKTIAASSDAGSAGIKVLAQEAQRFSAVAVEARTTTDNLTQSTIRLGAAHTAMVPQVAAASAAIRTFEGAVPIRAVERFAVNVLGLGPILQAAFPIVGLIAFSEIFLRTFDKLDPFIQAEKRLAEQTKKTGQEFAQLSKELERLLIAQAAAEGGPAAGKKVAEFFSTSDAAADKNQIKQLKEQIAGRNKEVAAMSGDYNYQISHPSIGGLLAIGATFEEGRVIQSKLKDNETDQQKIDALEEKGRVADQRTRTDKAEEDKDKRQNDKEAARKADEKAKQEAARRKAEEHRVQTMERAGISSPIARAYMKANDDLESFTDPDLKQRATQAGIADASRIALTELTKVQDELQKGRIEQQAQGRETDKRADENFRRDSQRKGEALTKDQEAANKVKTFQNSLTSESTSESVRANAAAGASADKMIGLNRSLSDAQKISALNQQDLATAQQKYQIEKDGAAELLGDDERAKARHKADLDNQLELQKVKEQNLERIAALEDKQISEFRGLIGGLFDAVASRQPNAIPNFVKGQVLGVGKTIAENAAQEYLFKPLQHALPSNPGGALGAILKGTGLTKDDPLKTTAAPALVLAANDLMSAARALATSRSGGGGAATGGGGGGFPMGGSSDSDGGGIIGSDLGSSAIDGLPISAGGASIGLTSPVSAASGGFGFNAGTIGSIAAAAGGAAIAAKDFSTGGVGKDLQGAGAVAGIAAGVIPLLATVLPALAGPLAPAVAAITAVALPLLGSLFDGPQRRANAINTELGQSQYIAPQALNATQDSSGDFTDFDARGNIRTSNFSAIPTVRQGYTWEQTHGLFGGPPTFYNVPGGQTSQYGAPNGGSTAPVINHNYGPGSIQTIDATTFTGLLIRNSRAVGDVTAKAMQDGHGALTTEVQRAANP